MGNIAIGMLWATALLTGGCSIFFLIWVGDYSFPLSLIGLAVAGAALYTLFSFKRSGGIPTSSRKD